MSEDENVIIIESLSDFEAMILNAGLTAERVLPENIVARIDSVEYCKHVTQTGKVLRWCIINMVNSFGITSPVPSCAVSIENDNETLGKRAALEGALNQIWQFEGYVMSENRFVRAKGQDAESQIAKLERIMRGEFGDKVGSFLATYREGNYHKK